MKPETHAISSARKFGGQPDEYLKIHDWFDQTKSHFGDNRHRAILHSSFGIFLCEQQFGHSFVNSAGRKVSVRDVGEQHVMEDMKFIPTVADYLSEMSYVDWMHGKGVPASYKKIDEKVKANKTGKTFIPFNKTKPNVEDLPVFVIDGASAFRPKAGVTPVNPLPEPPPRKNPFEDMVFDGSRGGSDFPLYDAPYDDIGDYRPEMISD